MSAANLCGKCNGIIKLLHESTVLNPITSDTNNIVLCGRCYMIYSSMGNVLHDLQFYGEGDTWFTVLSGRRYMMYSSMGKMLHDLQFYEGGAIWFTVLWGRWYMIYSSMGTVLRVYLSKPTVAKRIGYLRVAYNMFIPFI